MSERRDRLVALRKRVLMGDPPYKVDPLMKTKRREFGGKPGLEELVDIGDYGPGAASQRLTMELIRDILDDMIERTK